MKLRITVTKEILQKTVMCGVGPDLNNPGHHCAVAEAVREIFPNAYIGGYGLIFNHIPTKENPLAIDVSGGDIEQAITKGEGCRLPSEAVNFIKEFDSYAEEEEYEDCKKRLDMPEISFEIEVPTSAIDSLDIKEVERIISQSKTLELV